MKSIIIGNSISFELANGRWLFKNINFSISSKVTALVGSNGVGKTVLAKIMAGELNPTEGVVQKRQSIIYFPQKEHAPSSRVEDYLSHHDYQWSLLGENLLDGISPDWLCSQLSGGQWMRVRLAAKIRDHFLILDEPSNDLDHHAKRTLIQFFQNYSYGTLIISHDRELLNISDEVLELSNQGLEKYGYGFTLYEEAKQLERETAINELNRLKRERDQAQTDRMDQIQRQAKRNRQGKEFALRTGVDRFVVQGKKRMAQATTGKVDVKTLERAQEKVRMTYEKLNQMKSDAVMYADLMGTALPARKLIAQAIDFNIRFSDNWIYKKDLTFLWQGNIRLAIKGLNGSGKSTLVKSILGENFNSKGTFRSGGLSTLYLDQKCSILNESKSVFENVREVSQKPESELRNDLARLLFFGDAVFQNVNTLSGGERLRAALARGLLTGTTPELIIMDEPTNNLDLQNIEFLEGFLSQFRGALILISHDEVFLKACGVADEFIL